MEDYSTIRECLAEVIGKTIVEITQHDEAYFSEHGIGFVDLMLDSGDVLRIWSMRSNEPLMVINPDGDTPEEIDMV